ncbi:hypothetical protein B0T26DRAFT_675943 [Lasiosphaeria miniovina]|uniref:RING-type domain-containing protein n=1 Tax=Lasiosphaeria miniovina TaxID=1954250 RepID=A0AA40DYI1_9PEZI|nr:uncharacterized protein B0T26DRAFT_675943 [Lasiosphaeria miniovina]KAK0717666.1 hypothetical protein B0T26DRAFT_675943 [Lasiosphaeria miniovina]
MAPNYSESVQQTFLDLSTLATDFAVPHERRSTDVAFWPLLKRHLSREPGAALPDVPGCLLCKKPLALPNMLNVHNGGRCVRSWEETAAVLPCGHMMGQGCLDKLYQQYPATQDGKAAQCPVCNTSLAFRCRDLCPHAVAPVVVDVSHTVRHALEHVPPTLEEGGQVPMACNSCREHRTRAAFNLAQDFLVSPTFSPAPYRLVNQHAMLAPTQTPLGELAVRNSRDRAFNVLRVAFNNALQLQQVQEAMRLSWGTAWIDTGLAAESSGSFYTHPIMTEEDCFDDEAVEIALDDDDSKW